MTTKLEKLGVKKHKYKARNITFLEAENQLICPLCLEHKENWHVNHFVMKMDGGRETKYNLTVLCAKCHMLLHHAEGHEAKLLWDRLNWFMMSRHGVLGRKELLQTILIQLQMSLSIANVRAIHKLLKKSGETAYQNSMLAEESESHENSRRRDR